MSAEPTSRAGTCRVLVTRPLPAGRTLAERLEEAGLSPILMPVLEIAPPADPAPLRSAAARAAAGAYDWVVLTSANGVAALADALPPGGPRSGGACPPPAVPEWRLAVVGPATAAAAEARGWAVDLVPETYTAEGLLEALRAREVAGCRVLLPLAEAARDVLEDGLRALGAHVDAVVAYRSVGAEGVEAARLRELIAAGGVDLLTFASPSAAAQLLALAGGVALSVPAAVIGPVTGEAARRLGFRVVAEATPHDSAGLVAAVLAWAGHRANAPPPAP